MYNSKGHAVNVENIKNIPHEFRQRIIGSGICLFVTEYGGGKI